MSIPAEWPSEFHSITSSDWIGRNENIISDMMVNSNDEKGGVLTPYMLDDFVCVNRVKNFDARKEIERNFNTDSIISYSEFELSGGFSSGDELSSFWKNKKVALLFSVPVISDNGNFSFFLVCEQIVGEPSKNSYAVFMYYDLKNDTWVIKDRKEFARYFLEVY
jgi:hypothetical protein